MKKILILLLCWLIAVTPLIGQVAGSLYSDVKARQVGDVISVIIMETTSGSRESKSKSNSKSGMEVGASSSGNVMSFLPTFGGSGNLESNFTGSDGSEQKERLMGRLSVRIVEKTDNGMFKIEGERALAVNGEENIMALEGYVRPRDISHNNTVYSYQIADAEITYRKAGLDNRLFSDGTFPKLITWTIGGLMVAAALGYFAFQQ
ncbi:MAG TPA: flagellar basal body L-ring protein FlgH [Caldithrix abyssi]|uniref:Flagellar basal body L-ring protein FlgH n=1 Tax=Caldithrix abyssi TaxID=187145 RepID=A0A7V4TZC5_CALAY|nr:flagellar basal body L-ring protein FlgH [Caldithrix abyssi]